MPFHRQRRQNGAPTLPTVSGITGAATLNPSAVTATSLETDASGASVSISAPAIATNVPTITVTPTALSTTSDPTSTDATGTPKNSSSGISTGTTVAACVAAVAGVVIIVFVAWWFYRRYTRNLKREAQAASEKHAAARAKGSQDRSKKQSLENWNKMEEVGEADKISAKEIHSPIGMEQMTMFQKSPTVRSPASENMTEESGIFDHPFSQYHPPPNKKPSPSPPASQRHFRDRADPDSVPVVPWAGETARTDALLSLRSKRSSGNVSSKAIPTPPAVEPELYKWESAEVLQFEANPTPVNDRTDSASVRIAQRNNPFDGEAETRKTVNPFFNAQDFSNSGNSSPSSAPLSLKAQGKQRAIDPFINDDESPTMPVPPTMPFGKHSPSDSTASYNSDRAIQSLVNALEVSEEEVQERLRIASLQPSFISTSTYPDEPEDALLPS